MEQQRGSKDNYKYSLKKKAQVVNTIIGKFPNKH